MRLAKLYLAGSLIFFLQTQAFSALVPSVETLYSPNIYAYPSIYGNEVLFQNQVQGTYRFLKIDISTKSTTELRDNLLKFYWPAEYGNTHVGYIEWGGSSGGPGGGGGMHRVLSTSDCHVKMMSTGGSQTTTIVSTTAHYKEHIAVDGDRIVWTDFRLFAPGDTIVEIYLVDMSSGGSEQKIAGQQGYKAYPSIRGDKIVWQDYRHDTGDKNADIFLYDLQGTSEQVICDNPAYQSQPDVFGNYVVWQDYRNTATDADIYLYDIQSGEEKVICDAPGYQAYPRIYGDVIVWHDYRNASSTDKNADIYMYDLTTDTELVVTEKAGYQDAPRIYGNEIVWYDNSDGKIYIAHVDVTNARRTQPSKIRSIATTSPGGTFDISGRYIGRRKHVVQTGIQLIEQNGVVEKEFRQK